MGGQFGTSQYPEWYPNFEEVTEVELTSATTEDMALYWHCTDTNPNGNCGGLQIPCGRTCYPTSCGNVPDSCYGDLSWAATTGTKSHSWWYPDFESITGVSLDAATNDDVQLYWYCTGTNPNGNCEGLEAPCGRSCGNGAFTDDGGEDASDNNNGSGNLIWMLIAGAMALGVILMVTMIIVCIRKKRDKKSIRDGGRDSIKLKDDQQIKGVDAQIIDLEADVEAETLEITA